LVDTRREEEKRCLSTCAKEEWGRVGSRSTPGREKKENKQTTE